MMTGFFRRNVMNYRWWRRQRVWWVTVLQVIVILEILVAVGLTASGQIPAPSVAEVLAVLAIFLLGLPPMALIWLMFEVNRPDRG
jgi:uncharacterized membrane protein YfcA